MTAQSHRIYFKQALWSYIAFKQPIKERNYQPNTFHLPCFNSQSLANGRYINSLALLGMCRPTLGICWRSQIPHLTLRCFIWDHSDGRSQILCRFGQITSAFSTGTTETILEPSNHSEEVGQKVVLGDDFLMMARVLHWPSSKNPKGRWAWVNL